MSQRTHELYKRRRPYKARVKIDGVEYFLGYFATKEEGDAREDAFRRAQKVGPYKEG